MLSELTISNFAIIDHLRISLRPGLNVLTGETGAGKSIIIDAVSMLLGGRADTQFIRAGCDASYLEGVISLSPETRVGLLGLLEEHGLECSDDVLILSREINRNGRNTCRINGRAVTLGVFAAVGERLIDIHGQSEHLSLLRLKEQLDFLDRFGGLQMQRAELAEHVRALHRVQKELASLRRDERELARRADLLQYQVNEIQEARLTIGEEEDLQALRKLLGNAERLAELANDGLQKLRGGADERSAILDGLDRLLIDLTELERLDPQVAAQRQCVEEVGYQLEDLARALRTYRDAIEFDPQRLQETEERLDLIFRLKRKYGNSIEEILRFGEQAAQELDSITHNEVRVSELETEQARLRQVVGSQAAALSSARRECAGRLQAAIENELESLSMKGGQFVVDISWREADDGVPVDGKTYEYTTTGIDHVEFLISANVGEPPKPLAKVASGGETSRLMLALKSALSEVDQVPTLIFDEIDQGIGGRIGGIVGRKLWGLTRAHQVLCVTHLPQLASYGDVHLKVEKVERDGRTVTQVLELDDAARVEEIGLMLGGPAGETRRRSAQEMIGETLAVKRGEAVVERAR